MNPQQERNTNKNKNRFCFVKETDIIEEERSLLLYFDETRNMDEIRLKDFELKSYEN